MALNLCATEGCKYVARSLSDRCGRCHRAGRVTVEPEADTQRALDEARELLELISQEGYDPAWHEGNGMVRMMSQWLANNPKKGT